MLVGVGPWRVIRELSAVRSEKRANKRSHRTNVGELVRLLKLYGYDVERRENRDTLRSDSTGLLRVHHHTSAGRRRSSWHWCLIADGCVHDPAMHDDMDADVWLDETRDHTIYFYPVTKRS
jgi:hypothetical protein